MKFLANCIMAAVAVAAFSTIAYAQESTAADKPCCSKDAASACASDKGCGCGKPADMTTLPKMTYRVGADTTCCSKSAEALAAKTDGHAIEYVVGSQNFSTKQAAYTSLVEQTEAMVESFVTPCKCDVSGVTSIAGTKCACPTKAGETAEVVQNAIKGLKMTYAVGEESCSCPMKAKEMAKAAGTETTFVVAGEKTSCPLTARLNLARAKYQAAVAALASDGQPEAMSAESGT